MVKIKELSNGIRVVMENLPYVRSISFGIYVKNGSSCESEDFEGISHFIEHMLFKGTEKRSAKQIAEDMDELGGQINAYTTKEYTCYHTRTLDTHFDKALDILGDMFLNPKFDENDVKKERNVIIEEINMYDDDPEELVQDIIQGITLKGTRLSHPILGTAEKISAFNSEIIKNYFKENYGNDKTVISVVGNFEPDIMLEKLEKTFGAKAETESKSAESLDISGYSQAVMAKEKDTEQLHICIAFPGYKREDVMKYPYTIMNTVFGGGMSSMLFQKIREEKGLSYSIYSFPMAFESTGLFIIYTALNPSQAKDMCIALKECIKDLKTNGISEELLRKTKTQLISNFIIGNESTLNRMTSNGVSFLMNGFVKPQEEIIKEAEEVTLNSVIEAANYVFDMEKASIAAAGNISGVDFNEMLGILKE